MSTAATLLRQARRRSGLSQRALAARAGTSPAAIGAYESGSRDPSVTTLERILAGAGFHLGATLVACPEGPVLDGLEAVVARFDDAPADVPALALALARRLGTPYGAVLHRVEDRLALTGRSLDSRTAASPFTREERRSLALHRAVAEKICSDPGRAIARARRNLAHFRQVHTDGSADRWLDAWEALLDDCLGAVLTTLTSPEPRARDLRATAPFAGLLSDEERLEALASAGREGAGAA